VVITVGDTTMRKILTLVLFASLIVPSAAIADNPKHGAVRLGLVFPEAVRAKIYGPQSVLVPYLGERIVPIEENLELGGLALYVGLQLEKRRLAPGVWLMFFGTMSKPVDPFLNSPGSLTGWEVSVRYELVKRKPFWLCAVISLARLSPYQEKGLSQGYDLNEPFFLPGLGIGASVDMLHVEIKFHRWLGIVVGEAVEPGPPRLPSGYYYTLKPLRLNYAVSVLLALDFTLFEF